MYSLEIGDEVKQFIRTKKRTVNPQKIIKMQCVLGLVVCQVHWRFSVAQTWGGVAKRVARLTRNVEVLGSSPIKGPRCFPETFTLIALYWLVPGTDSSGPYERLT